MVCELLSSEAPLLPVAWGFIEAHLEETNYKGRPWLIIEASPGSVVYLPGLTNSLRLAASRAKLLWVHCDESEAPRVAQKILESSLLEGLLLRGLDRFHKSSPAALWGRRWQLAAERGASHLFWQHPKPCSLLGFDLRLEWDVVSAQALIKKQHSIVKGSIFNYGKKLYQESKRPLEPKHAQQPAA
jgi:hypothetical protein